MPDVKMWYMTIMFAGLISVATRPEKIRIIEGLKNQITTTVDTDTLNDTGISIHFLVATIGRSALFAMLDSLKDQVKKQDYLTIVFDGKDIDGVFEKVRDVTSTFACTTRVIFEEKNLGFWGHGIRNKYNDLAGDFVMHCDDDNTYLPSAIDVVRTVCRDKDAAYIFRRKLFLNGKYGELLWQRPVISGCNIDTGIGVIPRRYNKLCPTWEYSRGGETSFYAALAAVVPSEKIFFVDWPTYVWYGNHCCPAAQGASGVRSGAEFSGHARGVNMNTCGGDGSLLVYAQEPHGADVKATAWCCPSPGCGGDDAGGVCTLAIGGDPSPTDAATVRVYIINKKTGSFVKLLSLNTGGHVNAVAWCCSSGTTYYLAVAGSGLLVDSTTQTTAWDVLVYALEGSGNTFTTTCVAGYRHGAPVLALAWLCKPCGMYEPNIADRAYLAIGGAAAGTNKITARVLTFAGPGSSTPHTFVDPTYTMQTPVTIVSLSWCCTPGRMPLLAAGGATCNGNSSDCSNPACQAQPTCLCPYTDARVLNIGTCCDHGGPEGPRCVAERSRVYYSTSSCDITCCAAGKVYRGCEEGGDCSEGETCVHGSCCPNAQDCGTVCGCPEGRCCGTVCCSADETCVHGTVVRMLKLVAPFVVVRQGSAVVAAVCCSANETCVHGSCCPNAQACGTVCGCPAGQTCISGTCCPPSCALTAIFVYAFGSAPTGLGRMSAVTQRCCPGMINALSWCCGEGGCSKVPVLAIGCTPASEGGKNVILYALTSELFLKEFASATAADNGLKSVKSVAWYPRCPCRYLAAGGTPVDTAVSPTNVIIYERVVPHEQELKAIAGANLDTAVNTVAWCPCSDGCVYLAAGSASTGGTNADVAVWRTSPLLCDYGVAAHG